MTAALLGGLLGAIIGSFLATVAIRWPAGRTAMQGRSACDGCGRILSPVDLVPLIGWLALRGRCRTCGARIDPLHPAVELVAAAIGGLCLWLAPDARGAALAVFGWLLLLAAALDARHYWLPHVLSLIIGIAGLALGGLAMTVAGIEIDLIDRAIGAAAGFAGLAAVALAYRAIRQRDGLGGGDAPFLAAIGAWTGWQMLPLILLLATLAGLAVAGVGLTKGGAAEAPKQMLPFGTLLALAIPFALVAGPMLLISR
jgi:leader peptidase (prepilin peptidase) / N-methyltransferase